MLHSSSFASFLRDVVNINQTRLDELQTNVDAVFDALSASENLDGSVARYIPQGSWPHKTIIKPLDDGEFDADILLEFAENGDWDDDPVAYLDGITEALNSHGTYGDKLDGVVHSRCVRVIYASEHHLDIVAYRILDDGRKVIVNRDTGDWEDTDPEGFTTWIRDKDSISDGNFRKIVRLLKYLRDFHEIFAETPSIILTALAGAQVTAERQATDPGYYTNVPTALRNIVADLNEYLQANELMPTIEDPSGATHPDGTPVTFDHRWDQSVYNTLRRDIAQLTADIDAAYDEADRDRSVELWQHVFGDGFKGPDAKKNHRAPVLPPPNTGSSHRKPQVG
ncbi:MAG: nucleotidyltransferase [Actinomycetia bacterium]|nr:nucleotidyltransferase [Actinomycetes bacterium]